MGVVQGFSDVTNRVNLATNGSFYHNQRGFATSGFTNFAVNDYVSDCWKITALDIDLCQLYSVNVNGYLRFQGRGKKGQRFVIANMDLSPFSLPHTNDVSEFTCSVSFDQWANKVPIKVQALAKYQSIGYTTLYTKPAIASAPGRYRTVEVVKTSTYSPQLINAGYIEVTLLAEGEFGFDLFGYTILAGAFKNPPPVAPVHYSEDLVRCKRYYQNIYNTYIERFARLNTDVAFISRRFFFPVEMAGTPTPVKESFYLSAYPGNGGAESDRSPQYNEPTRYDAIFNASSRYFDHYIYWDEAIYAAQMYTNGASLTSTTSFTV